jgi:hypothetical protein
LPSADEFRVSTDDNSTELPTSKVILETTWATLCPDCGKRNRHYSPPSMKQPLICSACRTKYLPT